MRHLFNLWLAAGLVLVTGTAWAVDESAGAYKQGERAYEVTITNLTKGQSFTPQLIAAHKGSLRIFESGDAASLALEILAEGGDTTPLTEVLQSSGAASGVETIGGLLGPGQSVSMTLTASAKHRYFSMAAMLIPTNDTFVALNRVPLPRRGGWARTAIAYDAGTEANDQNCLNIPGPRCGGEGYSPGPNVGDEGFIYVSNGFHELPAADAGEVLGPATYDWRNPVARVVVRRIH